MGSGSARLIINFRLGLTFDLAATFKNPFQLERDADKMHPQIVSCIRTWFKAKEKIFNEKRVLLSEKITALELTTYFSREAVLRVGTVYSN